MIPAKYWSPTKKLMVLGAMAGGKLVEDTATGNPLTFITDKAKPLKSLLIPFTPIQSGTGDPSPQNIRSILPWNGLTVFGGGKNLLDSSTLEQGTISGSTGTNVDSTTRVRSGFVYAKGGTWLSLDASGAEQGIIYIYDTDGTFRTDIGNYDFRALPIKQQFINDQLIRICLKHTDNGQIAVSDVTEVMLNLGQTAEPYEAPHITETDTSFPSPVYGGTLDVVSGVLTVTHVCLEVKKRDFLQQGQGEMSYRQTPNNYIIQHKPKSGVNWSMARQTQKMECAVIANPYSETTFGNYIGVCLCDVTIPTTFRISMGVYDSMQNDDDSVSICYEIAEPFEIQLTPAQITAIIGNNTIWSDADGSMTAVYLKKG